MGKQDGFGKAMGKDSNWYEGGFKAGEFSGTGKMFRKMECLDGRSSIYEGSFERNGRLGQSTLTMSDGTIITGAFHGDPYLDRNRNHFKVHIYLYYGRSQVETTGRER